MTPVAGILYPGHSAEDDFPSFEEALGGRVALPVGHTRMAVDAHRPEQLRDWGRTERLVDAASLLRARVGRLDAVIWACTSGSFVYGYDGAHRQAREVADAAGVPASSTSLAYLDALRVLGLTRIGIAATYPADVAELFAEFLRAAGLDIVRVTGHGILTAAEVGRLDTGRLLEIARSGDHPDAQAVLLPDTAFHTAGHVARLQDALAKPVLTANQVTVWEALRLTGADVRCAALGALGVRQPGT